MDLPVSTPQPATTPTSAIQQDYSPTSISQFAPADIPTSPFIFSWIAALVLNAEPMTILNTVISILSLLVAVYALIRKAPPPPPQVVQIVQQAPQPPDEPRSAVLERSLQTLESRLKFVEGVPESAEERAALKDTDGAEALLDGATERLKM